jgi:hypothetical protein
MDDDSQTPGHFRVIGYTRTIAGETGEVRPHKRRRRRGLSRRRLNKVMRAIRWRKRQAMLKPPGPKT